MTRIRFVVFALIVAPAAAAAPVPTHLMPQLHVELHHKSADHPLGNTYQVVIRNTGSSELQVWTNRPVGLESFVDVEILNAKSECVSRPYPWSATVKELGGHELRETISAKKSRSITLALFTSVDDRSLLPGKYRLRVRFHYKDHDAVSEWLAVEVTEADIRTKNIVGP